MRYWSQTNARSDPSNTRLRRHARCQYQLFHQDVVILEGGEMVGSHETTQSTVVEQERCTYEL